MFEFHWPWMAILLPLPLLVRQLWPRVIDTGEERPIEGRRTTLLHPSTQRLESSFHSRRLRNPFSGRAHSLLLTLLWIILILALMRPQWLEPRTEVKTEGYDLMLAVDTSRSMTALDFSRNNRPISRMAVVKGVMGKFVENRAGDRVGLVIFGNQAFVQSPLTLDLRAVRQVLDDVTPGMAGNATAMGDAIALSIKKLREQPAGSRVLLLVTDGENTAGLVPPMESARLAVQEGVRIYAIGVGSNKQEVMIRANDGSYQSETDIGLDEEMLIKIAELTDGSYFRATNTRALEEIYKQIDTLEKTEAQSRTVLIPRPLFQWFLALALILFLILGLFPEGRMRTPGGNADG
ncbi:MAG: VWA domain-containing protein [Gammaproteobacteria bacterium]|nr:VWA domain-containing protein [Gammaproteobacteria bacterium]